MPSLGSGVLVENFGVRIAIISVYNVTSVFSSHLLHDVLSISETLHHNTKMNRKRKILIIYLYEIYKFTEIWLNSGITVCLEGIKNIFKKLNYKSENIKPLKTKN